MDFRKNGEKGAPMSEYIICPDELSKKDVTITYELRLWLDQAYTYDGTERVDCPWLGWQYPIKDMLDKIDLLHEAGVKQAYEEGRLNSDDCDDCMYEEEHRKIEGFEERLEKIENLLNHKTRA